MNCAEELIRRVEESLCETISPDIISLISGRLSEVLLNYDISPKTTNLSVPPQKIPKSVFEYLGAKKVEGLSDGSIEQYALVLKQFYTSIRVQDSQVTPTMIRAWLFSYQRDHGVSAHTIALKRIILHGYFEWAANNGAIGKNPCRAVASVRFEKPERRALTDEQLEQLRYCTEDPEDKALIEMLYSSGCRVSELCRLNLSDIDFQSRSVKLFGKGKKHRTSYISARAAVAIRRYLTTRSDSCPALFLNRDGHRPKTETIQKAVRKLGRNAGLLGVHPHQLRHTFATNAINSGMPIQELSSLLGHESLDTTMIYAHSNNVTIRNDYLRCVG